MGVLYSVCGLEPFDLADSVAQTDRKNNIPHGWFLIYKLESQMCDQNTKVT